jgi:hypothetical protein
VSRRKASSPAALSTPCDSAHNLYVGSLHSHTSHFDGVGTPVEAFRYARHVAGVDFLAIADHRRHLSPQEPADILYQADVFTKHGIFVGIGGKEWSGNSDNHSTVWDAAYVLTAPNADCDSLHRKNDDRVCPFTISPRRACCIRCRGQRVKTLVNEGKDAGRHEVAWDGTDSGGRRVSPGVYLCRLRAGGCEAPRKAVVVE